MRSLFSGEFQHKEPDRGMMGTERLLVLNTDDIANCKTIF